MENADFARGPKTGGDLRYLDQFSLRREFHHAGMGSRCSLDAKGSFRMQIDTTLQSHKIQHYHTDALLRTPSPSTPHP